MFILVHKWLNRRSACQKMGLVAAISIFAASGAFADDLSWNAVGGGSFSDPLNWLPQSVPGADDNAIFALGVDPAYEVTFYGSVTNDRCIFRTDKVMLDLGGFAYTLDYPGWGLAVGEDSGQVAEVLFYNGTLNTDTARIGTWAGSSGRLDLAAPLTMNVTLYLFVGNEGNGQLNVNDGVSLTADYVSIGAFGTANTGRVILDGPNAEFTVNYVMTVGDYAFGFLNLHNGASVNAPTCNVGGESTGDGAVLVTGESEFVADWLTLGRNGSGSLTVEQAAQVDVGDLVLGSESGSGWVDLNDPNSRVDVARYLSVGSSGHGVVYVSQQSALTADTLLVGAGAQGEMYISDTGTTVTLLNNLLCGQFGIGTIDITNGANVRTTGPGGWITIGELAGSDGYILVDGGSALTAEQAPLVVAGDGQGDLDIFGGSVVHTAGEIFMGSGEGSVGRLTIDGAGSKYISDSGYAATIGDAGTGELYIENGGYFEKLGGCFLGLQSTGAGTITLDGNASIFKGEQLSVGEYGVGTFNVNDGRVALGDVDPAAVPSGEMHVAGYYTQLTGTGTVVGDVVNISGRVMPGGDQAPTLTGVLTINGDYTQQDAVLAIKVKGLTAADEYGVLHVTGAASLDGELRIRLLEGFVPEVGQQFVVLTAGALSGQFETVKGPGHYSAAYAGNQVTVTMLHKPGDLNCDGIIDNFDINPFVLALSNPGAYEAVYPNCSVHCADCNADDVVDNFDINPFVSLLVGG